MDLLRRRFGDSAPDLRLIMPPQGIPAEIRVIHPPCDAKAKKADDDQVKESEEKLGKMQNPQGNGNGNKFAFPPFQQAAPFPGPLNSPVLPMMPALPAGHPLPALQIPTDVLPVWDFPMFDPFYPQYQYNPMLGIHHFPYPFDHVHPGLLHLAYQQHANQNVALHEQDAPFNLSMKTPAQRHNPYPMPPKPLRKKTVTGTNDWEPTQAGEPTTGRGKNPGRRGGR